jgi:hypothetical protein
MARVLILVALLAFANAQQYRSGQTLPSTTTASLAVTQGGPKATASVTAFSCATLSIDNTGNAAARASLCTVTVTAPNPTSTFISFTFRAPSVNGISRTAGASCFSVAGTFTCSNVVIPTFSALGAWTLSSLQAYDSSDPYNQFTNFEGSFPVTITVTGVADVDAPTLMVWKHAPTTLTVTGTAPLFQHESVQAWVNCSDAGSGCSSVTVYMMPPSGSPTSRTFTIGLSLSQIQGNVGGPGNWEYTTGATTFAFATPVRYVTGSWTIIKLTATDGALNSRVYQGAELAGICTTGVSLVVNQPTPPASPLINAVGFVHSPASIDVTGSPQSVTFNVTVEGVFTATTLNPTVRAYINPPDSRCSARTITLSRNEVVGANTVFQFRTSYSSSSLCNGAYAWGAISVQDSYGSKNVYGSCGSSSSSVCSDDRVDSTGAAASVQASIFVILAAMVAALFA